MVATSTIGAGRRRFRKGLPAILAAVLLAAFLMGCAGESQSNDSDGDAGHGDSSASSGQAAGGGGSSDNDAVSYANPGATEVPLNQGRDADPGSASLDAVEWTTGPVIQAGALVAAGTLTQDARLYEPMNDEPSAFSVYYGDNAEVLAELLPDLGPMRVWDTDATVAPSEFELEVNKFTIRAYSPLFMDVGPSDLLLRVWGYDGAGNPALLSVQSVAIE